MFEIKGKYSNAIVYTDNCEQTARNQIQELCDIPAFINSKIRIMPDVHAGAGCVIGFTADLGEKVIPNIVGVDIGCGMRTIELYHCDIDLKKLDNVIREKIPNGMNAHDYKHIEFPNLKWLYCYDELKNISHIERSIGTLGGGNHFIEVDKDENDNLYLVIHTGSRNLGKQVADFYQKLAIKECKEFDKEVRQAFRLRMIEYLTNQNRQSEIQETLNELDSVDTSTPNALCYLTRDSRAKYLHDMRICQSYAFYNRTIIHKILNVEMGFGLQNHFETVHNYIDGENTIRKGAISAKKGEKLLIPINMRDGCILGVGKGNPDWNYSAPHGAGRLMSRAQARKEILLSDFESSMNGIYTTSVSSDTIDEAPQAYKPMDEIIENIKDTVEVQHILKPIYNFKASE